MCEVLQAAYCPSGWCHRSCFPNENTEVKRNCSKLTYSAKELGFEPHFLHVRKRILTKQSLIQITP